MLDPIHLKQCIWIVPCFQLLGWLVRDKILTSHIGICFISHEKRIPSWTNQVNNTHHQEFQVPKSDSFPNLYGGWGFPIHKRYPYSLYRWGFLNEMFGEPHVDLPQDDDFGRSIDSQSMVVSCRCFVWGSREAQQHLPGQQAALWLIWDEIFRNQRKLYIIIFCKLIWFA